MFDHILPHEDTPRQELPPEELRAIPRWVVWRYEKRADGKAAKVPYRPDGKKASVNNPATWSEFDSALRAYRQGGYDGMGFVFSNDDDLIGVDLDNCIADGKVARWAAQIVHALNTYAEISPSGMGVKVVARAELKVGKRKGHVEIYSSGRFFTITGRVFHNAPIRDCTGELRTLIEHVEDVKLAVEIESGQCGEKLARLFCGDISAYDSASEADLAFCSLVAPLVKQDAGRIDFIFRLSALYRPKWDDPHDSEGLTYGQMTIRRALNNREGDASSAEYAVRDGATVWLKQTSNGIIPVTLANFTASVERELMLDNGAETVLSYEVAGNLADGTPLEKIIIPAEKFPAMTWPARWGVRANISAASGARERLREAIQLFSQGAQRETIYVHLGWRKIGDRWVYLHSGGAVGAEGVRVEPEAETLRRYVLPDAPTNPDDLRRAVQASLDLLRVADSRIAVPLWAAVYRAPTTHVVYPTVVPFAFGETGAFKSTLCALFLSHYGNFDKDTLPANWLSTANQLEKLIFLARDALLIIDDVAPETHRADATALERLVNRVMRSVGNRAARGRLRSDLSTRTEFLPNALVVATGEQLPLSVSSVAARILPIRFERGGIDLIRLTEAQARAELLPQAMVAYLTWLSPKIDELLKTLPKTIAELRAKAAMDGHARLPESVAHLYAGLDLGMAFAAEVGAISAGVADEWRSVSWDVLMELAKEHAQTIAEERPALRFVSALSAILNQGIVYLADKDTGDPPVGALMQNSRLIGWRDEHMLYLIPEATYREITAFLQAAGGFPMTQRAISELLVKEGLIIPGAGGRTARPTRIAGSVKKVWNMPEAAVQRALGVLPQVVEGSPLSCEQQAER